LYTKYPRPDLRASAVIYKLISIIVGKCAQHFEEFRKIYLYILRAHPLSVWMRVKHNLLRDDSKASDIVKRAHEIGKKEKNSPRGIHYSLIAHCMRTVFKKSHHLHLSVREIVIKCSNEYFKTPFNRRNRNCLRFAVYLSIWIVPAQLPAYEVQTNIYLYL